MISKVVVTGAGGQTGGLVFRKMLAKPDLFNPIGVTRSEESRKALLEDTGAKPEQVIVADVADDPSSPSGAALAAALAGCFGLVIATSAKVKPTGGTNSETGRPNMGFPDGQPYKVDWLGQKHQIDSAKAASVSHVVVCSSMGGTDPDHMLNQFGKNPDGTGGNILRWKRKAEKYLVDSGLAYTVIHPGGLINEPGGQREIVVGVDDDMLPEQNKTIPREDVAEVMCQSLLHNAYENRSFDMVSGPDQEKPVQTFFFMLPSKIGAKNTDYEKGCIPGEEDEKTEAAAAV